MKPKLIRKKLCKGCKEYYRPEAKDEAFKTWCCDDCGVVVAEKAFKSMKRNAQPAARLRHSRLNNV